jgi:hypothetical protein
MRIGSCMREGFQRHILRRFSLVRLLSGFFETYALGSYEKEQIRNDNTFRGVI